MTLDTTQATEQPEQYTPAQRVETENVKKLMSEYPDAFCYEVGESGEEVLTVNSAPLYMSSIMTDPDKQTEFQEMATRAKQVSNLYQDDTFSPSENPHFYENVLQYANLNYSKTPIEFTPNGIKYKTMDRYEFMPISAIGPNDKKRFNAFMELANMAGNAKKGESQATTQEQPIIDIPQANIQPMPEATSQYVATIPEISTNTTESETPSLFPDISFDIGGRKFKFEDLSLVIRDGKDMENIRNWLAFATGNKENPLKGQQSVDQLTNILGGPDSAASKNIQNYITYLRNNP